MCSSNKICMRKIKDTCSKHSECTSNVCINTRCAQSSCPAGVMTSEFHCFDYLCTTSADCRNGPLRCTNGRCLKLDGAPCQFDNQCVSDSCKNSRCASKLCPVGTRPNCFDYFCKNDAECFSSDLECGSNGRCLKKVGRFCDKDSECGTNYCPNRMCRVNICPRHLIPNCLDQQCREDGDCFFPRVLGCFAGKCKKNSGHQCQNNSECGSSICNFRCA